MRLCSWFIISRQPGIRISNCFFLLKTEIHMQILNTKPFLCDIRGPRYLQNKMRFWNSNPIWLNRYYILIIFNIVGSSQGPLWASFWSLAKILQFWGHCETTQIWIDLFQNRILFCKYLGPQISHRNGFVFKICVWISVFRRKKRFKNPILGYRDIKQKPSLIFFVNQTPVEL